jgi:membrane protein
VSSARQPLAAAAGDARPPGARLRRQVARLRRPIDAGRDWLLATFVGQVMERLLENEFIDRSVALAAKLFVSFFPFVLVSAALAPADVGPAITHQLIDRFGLSGESANAVRGSFAQLDQVRSSTGVLGFVLLLFYATSFTTALGRVYTRAWRRPPHGGVRMQALGVAWLVGAVSLVAVNALLGRIVLGPPGNALRVALAVLSSTAMWWWTASIMLRGEVRWRPLLPGAVLSAVGFLGYAVIAGFWMPIMVRSNEAQFGFFGVAMSLVTYFVGVSFIIVVASIVSPVLADGDGWLARWLRGPSDDVLRPGASPALAGPTGRVGLLRAVASAESLPFGEGGEGEGDGEGAR